MPLFQKGEALSIDSAPTHNKNNTAVQIVLSGGVVIVVSSCSTNYGELLFQRTYYLSSKLFGGDTVSIKQFICLEFSMESL